MKQKDQPSRNHHVRSRSLKVAAAVACATVVTTTPTTTTTTSATPTSRITILPTTCTEGRSRVLHYSSKCHSLRQMMDIRGGGGDDDDDEKDGGNTTNVEEEDMESSSTTTTEMKHDDENNNPQPKKKKKKKKKNKSPPKQEAQKTKSSSPKVPPEINTILTSTNYYTILNIDKSATSIQIKKAYRARALLSHPDKLPNNDRRAFDKVSEAYDVLSDETKRKVYDAHGLEGLQNPNSVRRNGFGSGGGSFQDEILKSFFGTSFSRHYRFNNGGGSSSSSAASSSSRPAPRNKNVRYQLEVTLEDLYNGKSQDIILNSPSSSRYHHHHESSKQKKVHLTIPAGATSGQSIKLHGEVDTIPDATPADVIIILSQKKHEVFTRKGDDLAMEVRLSLKEALTGYKKKFVHLDGREVCIGSPRVEEEEGVMMEKEVEVEEEKIKVVNDVSMEDNNEEENNSEKEEKKEEKSKPQPPPSPPPVIIKTGDVHVLKGEGMPRKSRHEYGDLYIQYLVEMPSSSTTTTTRRQKEENLTSDERETLAFLLDKLEHGQSAKKHVGRRLGDGAVVDAGLSSSSQKKEEEVEEENVQYLQVSSASDFGKYSNEGHYHHDGEEHLHRDDDEEEEDNYFHHSFGGRRPGGGPGFHYFSSGSGFGGTSFYSNSYGGGNEDDGSNVQCQQM